MSYKYHNILAISAIDLINKSHNTPVPYPTMPHQNIDVHISGLNGTLWDIEQVYHGICEIGPDCVPEIFFFNNMDILRLWCVNKTNTQ